MYYVPGTGLGDWDTPDKDPCPDVCSHGKDRHTQLHKYK